MQVEISADLSIYDHVSFTHYVMIRHMKAMEAQADLVKQIRKTFASTPVAGRSPLTVDYIARTLPHLHLDRAANDEQGRRRRNSGRHGNDDHVEDGRQGPARGDSARQGNKDGNRSKTKHSRRSPRRDRDSAFDRRSGTEQDNKKRKDNEEPAKKGMCRFCHHEWFEGHRCKEYYQTKAAKTEYVSRVATLKKPQAGPSDFEEALRDIKITDEDECKSHSKQLQYCKKSNKETIKSTKVRLLYCSNPHRASLMLRTVGLRSHV
ncbi:hypothetical protein [Absidia glauca]|uniref:Uncharacterized protein n=1 Tax=Absidia glauca TaxID=4829 RepID=A0A163J8G9_ABSGL|nr:hypothetical protein [Absidia glauca]